MSVHDAAISAFTMRRDPHILTALIAAAALREHLSGRVLAAVALSLIGVVAIARPGTPMAGLDPFALGIALLGAFLTASAYVVVRTLSRTEDPLVIVFYFPLIALPASLPAVLPVFVWPRGWEWGTLVGVGVFAQLGQVLLTRGLQREPAGKATALTYLQVAFAATWGFFFFDETPRWATAIGAVFILSGAAVAARAKVSRPLDR